MNNEMFRKIVSTKRYVLHRSSDVCGQVILNKNKLLSSFDGANGVKTGYTKKAGRCLVSSATRDDMTVIAVTLDCAPMFDECARLMNYAFDNYEMCDLSPKGPVAFCCNENCCRTFALGTIESIRYPVRKNGNERFGYGICDVKTVGNKAKTGDENGKLNIYLDKRLIFSQKLFII